MADLQTQVRDIRGILERITGNGFAGINGAKVLHRTLKNRSTDVRNRTFDAIVDSEGRGDFRTIEDAIDYVNALGGGDIFIWGGTYTPDKVMTITTPINIVGQNAALVTVNFASTAKNFVINSGTAYTTGTITSIVGGVTVTGSGTAWLANASAGQYIFLGTRWYLIAAVTGDTTLILAEAYSDNLTVPALAYRIATLTRYVSFESLTIENSSITAIAATDVRNFVLRDILFLTNNKGYVLTNVSEISLETTSVIASISNGYELTNCGFANGDSVASIGNGTGGSGTGAVFNNVKYGKMTFSVCDSNPTGGWKFTNVVTYYLTAGARLNTGKGFECVSGCEEVEFNGCSGRDNTSDNLKITATSDFCKVMFGHWSGAGGWGINNAAASNDKCVFIGNSFSSNASGTITDSGTGTVSASNTT